MIDSRAHGDNNRCGNDSFLECGHGNGFRGGNDCRGGDGCSRKCSAGYGGGESCGSGLDGICGNGSSNGRCGKGYALLGEEFSEFFQPTIHSHPCPVLSCS